MKTKEKQAQELSSGAVVRATAWSFAAELAAKIIVPVTNIILARILAPEAFGIIATINVVVSFAETISTAGFQKYLVQHDFKDAKSLHNSANVVFWTNFLVSFLSWLIIAVFNEQLASYVGSPGYGLSLLIVALSLPLSSLASTQEALFQRNLNFRLLFYRRLVVSFLPFFVTIPLALLGFGHWALIFGSLAGLLAKILLMTFTCEWRPSFFFSTALLKEMLAFGLWTLLESVAMWASSYIDILIISSSLGAYYTGIYRHSQTTVTGILSIITASTTTVLFSSLSRIQKDNEKFKSLFYTFQKNVGIIVLPLGVGIFCFKELITAVLLGPQWTDAAEFIGIWGLCTSLVAVFGTFSREVYRAKGKPKISLFAQLLHLGFVIPVCLIAVKQGFPVLIYARSFAFLQIIVVHMILVRVYFKISPFRMLLAVKEPILSATLMGLLAMVLKQFFPDSLIAQLLNVFICAAVYFVILFIFPEYRILFRGMYNRLLKRFRGKKVETE